jgi:hypothetical protein
MSAAAGSWADWRQEVFGEPYLVWHDGPSFDELQARFAHDPAVVTTMLAAGLDDNDSLAATSMRELEVDDGQRATFVKLLTAALLTSAGSLQVEIGASLAALTGDESHAAEVVAVLDSPTEHWGVRLDAARRLAAVSPTPELVDALVRGVCDPDYLVRYHSATTLRTWAGRTKPDPSEHAALFALLCAEDSPDEWAKAAELLRGEVERAD